MDANAAEDLKSRYLTLLDEEKGEQVYQEFLEQNTRLIPREFIQNHGLHFRLVIRKFKFGADYVSDYFYMSKSSDDWNLVFVEIEKPSSKFFKGSTMNFHPDFSGGLQQINKWRAWLSDPDNQATIRSQLSSILLPLGMIKNPMRPKFVLVTGRRGEYGGNPERRKLIAAQEREDFKIMSFDSLAEDLTSKPDLHIGIKHNEYIEVRGDRVLDHRLYLQAEPSLFSVSQALKDHLNSGTVVPTASRMVDGKEHEAYGYFADRVRVRST